jgi:hypothetical protein
MFPHMRSIFTLEELVEMGAKAERGKENGSDSAASRRPRSAAP